VWGLCVLYILGVQYVEAEVFTFVFVQGKE
jgi:hypothetical protein